MTLPIVLADADVLYSATLRGWLLNLIADDAPSFNLVVTEDIIAETISHIRDNNPRLDGGVTTSIARHLRELCVVQEDFDGSLPFPGTDDGDQHVHAAAVASGAGYLVTKDKGFLELPASDDLPYEIYSPDEFLLLANAQSPIRMLDATRASVRHRQRQIDRGDKPAPLVDALKTNGCPEFAKVVQEHLVVLTGAAFRVPRGRHQIPAVVRSS